MHPLQLPPSSAPAYSHCNRFVALSRSVPFLKRDPCFIHCEGKAAKGGGVLMSIMIPSCNAHAYMKFSKKHFAPYAKNARVKNIITINKCNVGMKSLDRAKIVSDSLKTETSPVFISLVRVPVPVPFPAPLPVPDSGFSIRPKCTRILNARLS